MILKKIKMNSSNRNAFVQHPSKTKRYLCHMEHTVLHLSMFPVRILSDSITIKAAMMAFVVAIAGMMFPAIDLMSNLDLVAMPNMCDLMFAAAVTKSIAASSS